MSVVETTQIHSAPRTKEEKESERREERSGAEDAEDETRRNRIYTILQGLSRYTLVYREPTPTRRRAGLRRPEARLKLENLPYMDRVQCLGANTPPATPVETSACSQSLLV